jgi:hypothetical protein
MAVLDALNWPVLRCPRLAGFEVSPEVKGNSAQPSFRLVSHFILPALWPFRGIEMFVLVSAETNYIYNHRNDSGRLPLHPN